MIGVPYAVLWGVVSFLFSFVPNIGFVLALIPPTVLAFLDGGLGPALAVVGGYVAINLAFDYVLQPRVMSTELDISPVVVIVCILFWTFIIGPAGRAAGRAADDRAPDAARPVPRGALVRGPAGAGARRRRPGADVPGDAPAATAPARGVARRSRPPRTPA